MPDNAVRSARIALADGKSVLVRELRASDRGVYEETVAGLSPRSRYLRFETRMPSMSGPLLDQMMRYDTARHVALGTITPDDRTIVGVVRFVATHEPRAAG